MKSNKNNGKENYKKTILLPEEKLSPNFLNKYLIDTVNILQKEIKNMKDNNYKEHILKNDIDFRFQVESIHEINISLIKEIEYLSDNYFENAVKISKVLCQRNNLLNKLFDILFIKAKEVLIQEKNFNNKNCSNKSNSLNNSKHSNTTISSPKGRNNSNTIKINLLNNNINRNQNQFRNRNFFKINSKNKNKNKSVIKQNSSMWEYFINSKDGTKKWKTNFYGNQCLINQGEVFPNQKHIIFGREIKDAHNKMRNSFENENENEKKSNTLKVEFVENSSFIYPKYNEFPSFKDKNGRPKHINKSFDDRTNYSSVIKKFEQNQKNNTNSKPLEVKPYCAKGNSLLNWERLNISKLNEIRENVINKVNKKTE